MLTKEQQDIVTKNHDLIYGCANKYGFPLDEYYDILAIGLCKAANKYLPELGEFSTFAYTCMFNEATIYWRTLNKQSTIPKNMLLSYDNYIMQDDDDCGCFIDCIYDNTLISVQDMVISNVVVKKIYDGLKDYDKKIVNYLLQGFSQVEISKKLNCSRQHISQRVIAIRKKLKPYLIIS